MEQRPVWSVYENVMNILSHRARLFSIFRAGGLLDLYTMFCVPVCPHRSLGLQCTRPRLFFILVRKDVQVADRPLMSALVHTLVSSVRPGSVQKPRAGPRLRFKGLESKGGWKTLHERVRDHLQLTRSRGNLACDNLTERELDLLNMVVEAAKMQGQGELFVDVSQSIHRAPALWDVLPTLTTSSKVVRVSGNGKECRLLSATDKLGHMGVNPDSLVIDESVQSRLCRLAGNAMHVDAVALAMALAMALVDWRKANIVQGQPSGSDCVAGVPAGSTKFVLPPQVLSWKLLETESGLRKLQGKYVKRARVKDRARTLLQKPALPKKQPRAKRASNAKVKGAHSAKPPLPKKRRGDPQPKLVETSAASRLKQLFA